MSRYKIISADNVTDLVQLVNEAIEAGFHPIGGVMQSGSWCQAVYSEQVIGNRPKGSPRYDD